MRRRLLYYEDGVAKYHYYDHDQKKTVIETEDHNVAPLLDINQRRKNDADRGWKGDMHHVASIPGSLWEEWWREFGGNPMSPEHRPKLMRKLRDREFSKLRTKEGRI